MAAKISQEERERQIKQLCEGTIYSFVGWDGEYRNGNSKFLYSCPLHGEKNIRVYNFVNQNHRCVECANNKKSSKADDTERKIRQLCEGTIYSFVKWKGEYLGVKSRFICKCEKHGEWTIRADSFILNESRCNTCHVAKKTKPHDEVVEEIKRQCEGTRYTFVKWKTTYKNSTSIFLYQCSEHGVIESTVGGFLHAGSRCVKCAKRYNPTLNEVEAKIKQILSTEKYSFYEWLSDYRNIQSKFVITCPEHGPFICDLEHLLYRNSRCASCAVTGYKPHIEGNLYCLRSQCGQFVKIGITNRLKRRLMDLSRDTPFDFYLTELFTHEDGSKARKWEKLFHQSFESANLTGFDGCTEWLKWNPQIPLWFRFLT